jgi:hypothetical protein
MIFFFGTCHADEGGISEINENIVIKRFFLHLFTGAPTGAKDTAGKN